MQHTRHRPNDALDVTIPTPESVGTWYDTADSFCKLISGDSFHYGLWLKDDGTPATQTRDIMSQAQDRMTDFFIDLLRPHPGQSLLDVGCGHGSPAIRLAQRSHAIVTGCTVSHAQVEEANRRSHAASLSDRVRFEYGNAMDLPYEQDSFDAAWALDSFPHMNDPAHALSEIRRVVRPGAAVLVTFYTQHIPATDAELNLCCEGFAFCPLPTTSDVLDTIREVGFDIEQFRDMTREKMLSSDVFGHIYRESREEISREFGLEFVNGMDATLPRLLKFLKEKTGYVICLLRKRDIARN